MLLPAINATSGRGLVNDDLNQAREIGRKFFPKPAGHDLDGGVFQAGNFVEIAMIEQLDQGVHRPADLGVIVNPTRGGIDLALDDDLDLETVAMHGSALMTSGDVGERLGGFKTIIFGKAGFHR